MGAQKAYSVTVKGGDPYIEGDLEAARAVAMGELEWVHMTRNNAGAVLALAGDTTTAYDPTKGEDYWGAGATDDEALRFLFGAVLESEEEADRRNA